MNNPVFTSDQGIISIPSISAVNPILPIAPIPRIAITYYPILKEFRIDSLPAKIQDLFKKGKSWLEILDEAILAGLKDLNLLS